MVKAVGITRIELERIALLSCSENLPRIAHVGLPPALACIAFPTRESAPAILDGAKIELGDVLYWGPGQRFYTRTTGAFDWGCILFKPKQLKRMYPDLKLPDSGWMARPANMRRLLRLHSQAEHAAQSMPYLIRFKGPAGELERLILEAAVDCLAASDERELRGSPRSHAEIMNRFEDIVETDRDRRLSLSAAYRAMAISGRTLRACCQQHLGVSPHRYLRLRRLNLAREALLRAGPHSTVREISSRYAFKEPGRFAVLYRLLFGESPSATLRHRSDAARGLPRLKKYVLRSRSA